MFAEKQSLTGLSYWYRLQHWMASLKISMGRVMRDPPPAIALITLQYIQPKPKLDNAKNFQLINPQEF